MKEKLEQLKIYFKNRDEVMTVYIFGSYVKNTMTSESDVDIAIYFQTNTRGVEYEEEKIFPTENKIWGDVERILGKRVDLIILNRAPSTMVFGILQNSNILVAKNNDFLGRFYLTLSSAAEYMREFIIDFVAIKARSHSLNESDRVRLLKTIDFINEELKDYSNFKKIDQKTYENDKTIRRNMERWSENVVNSSIDIAKIILASEHASIPETYRLILEDLSKIKGFDKDHAQTLSIFAKMRNILEHEYLDMRFIQLKAFTEKTEEAYIYLSKFASKFAEIKDKSIL